MEEIEMINRDCINNIPIDRAVAVICRYKDYCRVYNPTSRLCNQKGGGVEAFLGLTEETCPNCLILYKREMLGQLEHYQERGD